MTTEFILRDHWLRDKFERQTRPLLAALYQTARRLTGQPADAEDLVHDTYVKAFQAFQPARRCRVPRLAAAHHDQHLS